MCGIFILGGKKFFIDCNIVVPPEEIPRLLPFKFPPIDFTQFVDELEIPPPTTPWREELTFLGSVLAGTSVIGNRELAAELGKLAADIGTRIAKHAEVDVSFEWDDHRG
jgi:hypothetical protein